MRAGQVLFRLVSILFDLVQDVLRRGHDADLTLTMGSSFAYAGRRIATAGRHFASVAGAVSVALGLFIACQIGFVDGLFRAQAHWIPR